MSGAVAVVASASSLAARAERACARREVPVACAVAVGPAAADVGAALDQVARRDDVAAVLMVVGEVTDHGCLAAVARAVSPHLPVVFVAAAPPSTDPYWVPWLGSLGVLRAPTLAQAVDAVAVARAIDPPAGPRCLVVGEDTATVTATAAACRLAGLDVTARTGGTLDGALGDLSHDLVVVVTEEPAEPGAANDALGALVDARRRHTELPLVVVADGGPTWSASLRGPSGPLSYAVVDGDLDLAAALGSLAQWAAGRTGDTAALPRPRDPGRLRRVVHALRAGSVALFAPGAQAELAGAMGLPFPPFRRVPYREDAVIAAAEIGYPVRLAAVHDAMAWPEAPRWVVATTSDELLRATDEELASVQRAAGRRAELVVGPATRGAYWVSARAGRHPDYGLTAVLRSADRVGHVVAPLDEELVGEVCGGRSVSGPQVDALVAAARAALGVLAELPDVGGAEVVLDVGPSGFLARHASLSLRSR